MASIFISHSSKDNTWAGKLKAWLEAKNHRSLFLDFDREAGIRAGDLWEQELYKKLRQCKVVLALVSHSWLESRWCFAEAVQAREKGKRLILGQIDATADTSGLFRDAQHLDFTRDEADAFTRLEVALADVFDIRPGREPYPGLIPFDEADAGVFVGRDPEIDVLLEVLESMRLKSRAGGECLLLLLGASGSGKSSLVRAGVLPHLRRLPERWQLLPPMRPGQDPVRELALRLATILHQDLEAIAGRLAAAGQNDSGPLQSLTDEVRLKAGQPEATVLLVLDQMEELLGLSEAQSRGRFLDILRCALERGNGRLLVLATLRSEYLGEVQLLPFLTTPTPLPYREQTLAPVPLDRLEAIIREPGRCWPAPIEFADRLVERMMQDTGTRDALPLLAFTLNRLWRDTAARADGEFKLEEYERLGGIEGSVQTAADEALALRQRTPAELEALREAFVPGLVRVDAEGVRTRRRGFLADLTPAMRALLKPFVDRGLLVTSRDPEGRETIEVAHEALLRTWVQLDRWLEKDQDALRLLNGLERAARDWQDGECSPELLAHRAGRLTEIQGLLGQPRFQQVVGETERRYLEACVRAKTEREAQEREERERRVRDAERIAEEQRKVARRTKMGALIALVLMAAAIGAAVVAWQQRDAARLAQTHAEVETQRATARNLATQATLLADRGSSPDTIERAAAFAVGSWERLENSDATEAASKLVKMLPVSRIHPDKDSKLSISSDGEYVAAAGVDGVVRLFSVKTGQNVRSIKHETKINAVSFSPDGRVLATGCEDGTVRMIDPPSGSVVSEYAMVGSIEDLAFSPDGRWLAIGNGSPPPELLSQIRREEEQKEKLETRQKTDAELDKFRLSIQEAFDNDSAMQRLMDSIRNEIREAKQSKAEAKQSKAIDYGGDLQDYMHGLAIKEAEALNDRGAYTSRLIDVSSGEEVMRSRHNSPVERVVFSPVSSLVVAADRNHLRLLNVTSKAELARIEIKDFSIVSNTIAFSPDGHILVVTHSYPEQVAIFDALTGRKISSFEQKWVSQIIFSSDSRYFLSRSRDDARIIEADTGRELLRGGASITRFKPDSKDPHSGYMNAKRFDEMKVETQDAFGGLGIEVTMEGGLVKVVSPIHNTPAFKAGIEPGDLITHLDGEQVLGMSLSDAVEKMRGPAGSSVKLTIRRADRKPFEVTLTRSVIKSKPVEDIDANCQASDEQVFASAAGGRLILMGVDGRERYQQDLHAPITAITFSPDGCLLAVGTGGGIVDKMYVEREASNDTLWLFEASSGRELFHKKHEYAIERVAFSPDGHLLVTSESQLGRVITQFILVPQGRYIARMEHPSEIVDLSFVQNGRLLVARTAMGLIEFIDPLGGRDVTRIDHGGEIGGFYFSDDARYMATHSAAGRGLSVLDAFFGGRVRLIELESGREVTRIRSGGGISPGAIEFSPDSKFLALGDRGGSLRLIETSTGQESIVTKHSSRIDNLAFSSDGSMLAFSVEKDKVAVVVEPGTGREIGRISLGAQCYNVSFSSDNRVLAIESDDKTVRIVEAPSGGPINRIEHQDSPDFAFSPDGRFLATHSRKDPTRLFEATTGHEIAKFDADFAFSPDSRSLAVAAKNNLVLITPETGQEFARIEHGGPIRRYAFSPNGRLIVTTSEDAATTAQEKSGKGDLVRFLNGATGEEIARFKHDSVAEQMMFSPDSRLLALAAGGAVGLIQAASGREIAYADHGGKLNAMQFSPDGQFLATGSQNNLTLILRTEPEKEGREVARIEHDGSIWWTAFSPDSRVLATRSGIDVLRLIRPDPKYVFDLLCSRAGRNLTRSEWNAYIGPTEHWRPTCTNWRNPEETQASAN